MSIAKVFEGVRQGPTTGPLGDVPNTLPPYTPSIDTGPTRAPKKPHPARMSPTEYRAILRSLGLSQHRAAKWLGVSARTGQNYATKGPPEPIARMLRAWVRLGLGVGDLT